MQIPASTSGIIGGTGAGPDVARPGSPSGGAPISFEKLMARMLHEADQPQQAVAKDMDNILSGEVNNIHDVAINVAKADVAFRLVMEVRDKLIAAYQDVMRMQV